MRSTEPDLRRRLNAGSAAPALLGVALVAAAAGCRPAEPPLGSDLMAALARGVFVAYGEPIELGRPQHKGDFDATAPWAPVPIVPTAGWQAPGRGGWLPTGARAVLEHSTWGDPPGGARTLRLDLRRAAGAPGPLRLTVVVAGSPVGEVELEPGFASHTFALPAAATAGDERIELLFDPPLERRPGVQPVTLVAFALAGEEAVRGEPSMAAAPPPVGDEGVLHLARSGRLVAPLLPYPRPDALELELRCPQGSAALVVSGLDARGEEIFSGRVEACGRTWSAHRVPVGAEIGGLDSLAIDLRLSGPEASAELRRTRFSGSAPGGASATPQSDDVGAAAPSPRTPAAVPRPDILLIVLDAARAGHFGFAGYRRDTTPHIDRLASEALVFERAYSECPNTSCSIPNLITGVPFLDVGTVFRGRRVPEELTTLAEYLRPLGYRTVGFSANPNNSVSRNSHQGFERFERLWGAHIQAEQARQVIAEQPADQPLYLQLHLLPPHQPYMPTPEFDLFTDPDYRGPVHPKIGLRRYTAGFASFTPADLEQLIALYDGNLRMADDAVSLVLEALEESGRWERTLVVLTSDHGEAFGEHGDFQHNSTLFDEMLHVPLVVRLPGGERPPHVDTASDAALADVVPTLLGYLGLEPRPEVWGVDLLAPGARPSRPLFHRTSHTERWLMAVRTERFKAITGHNVRPSLLFDRAADPAETSNLAARHPALFSGLVLRLRDFIELADVRSPRATEDVELTSEEIETLRALGYVQ